MVGKCAPETVNLGPVIKKKEVRVRAKLNRIVDRHWVLHGLGASMSSNRLSLTGNEAVSSVFCHQSSHRTLKLKMEEVSSCRAVWTPDPQRRLIRPDQVCGAQVITASAPV